MDDQTEWYKLQNQLHKNDLTFNYYNNQFFHRLLVVLNDHNALDLDTLLAYKDALQAAPKDIVHADLPISMDNEVSEALLKSCSLVMIFQKKIRLSDDYFFSEIDLSSIYHLEQRRVINKLKIDPALKKKLNDDRFQYYNGAAQQMAVRLSLTSDKKSTILVNLPTGCGKTLIAHALSLFTSNNKLTLVIVPTIALAIDQGQIVAKLLNNIGQDHGGAYCWYGSQTKSLHDDIKERIRNHQQRILFCSPEAACQSLLPTLFSASESNGLANIVIDEAHLIDQWGADFRPYFQIFSSVARGLRDVSPEGIKCILMSATFIEKNIRLLKNLFGEEDRSCIEIHGNFLRPEIQYQVVKTQYENYNSTIISAILNMPKPMLVYASIPKDADEFFKLFKRKGMNRIGLFTGGPVSGDKETLIKQWNEEQLDIMFATSAFGVGMDKPNIRSIIHIAVPENMDSFYQQVGRAGRDGKACLSLLIYYEQQFKIANELNNQTLIGTKKGLERWIGMWKNGTAIDGGKRKVSISNLLHRLQRKSDENESWNRRTLLLMQRAEIIKLSLERPEPPEYSLKMSNDENQTIRDKYYINYYKSFIVTPLDDNHLDKNRWDDNIEKQLNYEKKIIHDGFFKLKKWIKNHKSQSLCHELSRFYTINTIQPEHACGGCPTCRENKKLISPPTLGYSAHVFGVSFADEWKPPLRGIELHKYVCYPNSSLLTKKTLRKWMRKLSMLIEVGAIQCVYAENDVLEIFNDLLSPGIKKFWIGIPLEERSNSEFSYWAQLVFVKATVDKLPDFGWADSTKLLIVPHNINDNDPYNSLLWEKKLSTSVRINDFLLSF